MMFVEEDDVAMTGTSATNEYVVRHMIGGRSDMLWLDSRNSYTNDHTRAQVFDEVGARIAAEGSRVTYKEQENYVFDVVPKDQIPTLLAAAKLKIEAEARVRETTATAPGGGAPASLYERYERGVKDGSYSVDSEGFFVDESDGCRIEDASYDGGYARQGYHLKDPAAPCNRPKDPDKFDVVAVATGPLGLADRYVHATYASVMAALGCGHTTEADGWHVSTAWIVEFHDGVRAMVSDYDQSELYDDTLLPVAEIRGGTAVDWKIEGDPEAVDRLAALL